ncbi:28S ribosomal protein S9, mitochondrial [Contarinia nasturtii]|uniref:28S ribosomal protein S9, mitochondrial n=1 Tax=Contarinia nasturtii TaxID=265458 RepID=UPI0012D4278B|nr:28S ribosomal protein S9, mitochondrial [Contarinia nasturtii]
MSLLGNSLLRGILRKKLCSHLRLQVNPVQIKPQQTCNITTVASFKIASPTADDEHGRKMNLAAKIFLDRAKDYDEMIQIAGAEYRLGMRHLANMMGADPETFTQADADAAIEYLFPSALNDKKARPFMKPPEEVFPPRKNIQIDRTGRPFHSFFFTGFPNYYEACHDAYEQMKMLDKIQDKEIRQNKTPNEGLQNKWEDSVWMTKGQLEDKIIEGISDKFYSDFILMMERLLEHPYSYKAVDFIMKFRIKTQAQTQTRDIVEPKIGEDGRKYVTSYKCRFKSALAEVTIISPGSGKIEINGKDISYFETIAPRETVLFPLHFTDMVDKVDIVANVVDGGFMGQAGAIRYGVALGLRSFVDEATMNEMHAAGLLTFDRRARERKKPGQEGARRKFTWKKR